VTRSTRQLTGPARIAVDLLGGDHAPAVVVDGALIACSADPDLRLVLVGPTSVADEVLAALSAADRSRMSVARATRSADRPLRAARPGTTVGAAVDAVLRGDADALVSAGDSGATVTAAVLGLGRAVRRPPLAAMLPGLDGPVVLLDVGASVDPSPPVLVQHAVLGAAYAGAVLGLEHPRVGLLSIGTEADKGDRWRRTAHGRLALIKLPSGAQFVGNVEGYDVSRGARADVVVTDGFTGNVLLKGVEAAYVLAGGEMSADTAPRAAALLGTGGTVIVCHGEATGPDVASGIELAAQLHRLGATARLGRSEVII
jgi:glycerol-3-phosphate acyltransferase PlsX